MQDLPFVLKYSVCKLQSVGICSEECWRGCGWARRGALGSVVHGTVARLCLARDAVWFYRWTHLHASLVWPEDGGSRPVFVPNLFSDTASCPAVITCDDTGRSVLLNAVRNNCN